MAVNINNMFIEMKAKLDAGLGYNLSVQELATIFRFMASMMNTVGGDISVAGIAHTRVSADVTKDVTYSNSRRMADWIR